MDHPAALDLATQAGVQGVYIANVLSSPKLEGKLMGLFGDDHLLGLVYCGPRGNLLIVQRVDLDPGQVAQAILAEYWQWRIVLGPSAVLGELVRLGNLRAVVHRSQIYYGVTAEQVVPASTEFIRLAVRKDLKPLMEASLHLNETDLLVQPWRVDRDWLRRNTRARIKDKTTYLLGPDGRPVSKLDVGSIGPAGVVIEGVYTWPKARGRGHAVKLVTGLAAKVLAEYPLVCLHVAADNGPARKAYEKCGMRELARCQLLLRD